ncbi:ATP synthase subunit I [Halomonas sp. HNIBRBA4712]|uniref:ATP synthase subunit I n=1 Tax=Halomonas sp. HNIBRBA4712 TaxID=3373087 RepID=UPI0037470FCC
MQRFEIRRRRAYSVALLRAQLGLSLLGTGGAYWLSQTGGAISFALGALVAVLPYVFFIQRMGIFSSHRVRGANVLLRAEAGKFGLTVALFTLVFVAVPPSNPTLFFSAYVAVISTHWLAPWLMLDKPHNQLR